MPAAPAWEEGRDVLAEKPCRGWKWEKFGREVKERTFRNPSEKADIPQAPTAARCCLMHLPTGQRSVCPVSSCCHRSSCTRTSRAGPLHPHPPCKHLWMQRRGEPWPLREGDRRPFKARSPSSSRANKKTNTAESRLKARAFFHFPCIPDPNLNPHSESCQPGCSSTDIAAGIFSAAFPQICLLLGHLKRTLRFLCYWMIHSVPSSKALGLPGGGRRQRGDGGCDTVSADAPAWQPGLGAGVRWLWALAVSRGSAKSEG